MFIFSPIGSFYCSYYFNVSVIGQNGVVVVDFAFSFLVFRLLFECFCCIQMFLYYREVQRVVNPSIQRWKREDQNFKLSFTMEFQASLSYTRCGKLGRREDWDVKII